MLGGAPTLTRFFERGAGELPLLPINELVLIINLSGERECIWAKRLEAESDLQEGSRRFVGATNLIDNLRSISWQTRCQDRQKLCSFLLESWRKQVLAPMMVCHSSIKKHDRVSREPGFTLHQCKFSHDTVSLPNPRLHPKCITTINHLPLLSGGTQHNFYPLPSDGRIVLEARKTQATDTGVKYHSLLITSHVSSTKPTRFGCAAENVSGTAFLD